MEDADLQTLDVKEAQFLLGIDDDGPYHYCHYLGMIRINASLWVVASGNGGMELMNRESKEIIPLTRSSHFPRMN